MLAQQWIAKLPYYSSMCSSILQEMIALVCREYGEQQYPYRKVALVHLMQQYMMEHYTQPIRIDDLASLIERTPNYVSTLFKDIMKQTPIEYLHQLRISAARELLLNTNKSIAQVAEELGFCDQAYFNRVYKKHVGAPPSALLKERHR
jgi:YesN/AraC family two-component response regulator